MNRRLTERIVIIGGVAAGTSAAAKARRNSEQAEITIYDKDAYISYSGCGLPYYIGGRVPDMAALTPRDPSFFQERYNVAVLIRHEVLSVDPEKKTLRVKDLETGNMLEDHYDKLVLATGARPVLPPIPGAQSPHVFTLRNPGDALAIRTFMDDKKPKTAVVIGSGFIGLEMVENLAHAGLSVSLVEQLPHLSSFLDDDMAIHLEEHLRTHQIQLHTGQKAARILQDAVLLENGTMAPADLVILATGIRPETKIAEQMGVRLGLTGAIAVNASMQTNLPDVFACGDCAESFLIVDGRPVYRPLGSTANKTGRIAGDVITGGDNAHRGVAGTGIFGVFDMTVAACGLREHEARLAGYDVVICHNTKPDKPAYFGGREMTIKAIADRSSEKLLGVQIVGYAGVDKRIDVFVTAMTAGLGVADLFHLDLAYAPPFATTKDPVLYTGMILDNIIHRDRPLLTAQELANLPPGQMQVIDTRVPEQFERSHVDQAVNMPHAELRRQVIRLDPNRPVLTYCNKGTTGNAAQNILKNHGFKTVYNLSGGNRQYQCCRDGLTAKNEPDLPEKAADKPVGQEPEKPI